MPQLYMIIPVGGLDGNRPDNSLPGGGPVDPGYGRPGWSPVDPGYGRPDFSPGHPGNRPPGSWDGTHPGGGPVVPPVHIGGGPILNPELGTPVPPEEFTPEIPPESISSQYLVSVYDPKTQTWTTKSFTPQG